MLLSALCAFCACESEEHTCTPSAKWSSDKTSHWHGCSGCSRKFDFTAHTEGEPVNENIILPTLEKNGSRDIVTYCTDCNRELSREFKVILLGEHIVCTGGEPVVENLVPASCTEAGSRDIVVYCTDCPKELSRVVETIKKIPHTDGRTEENIIEDSTCSAEGKKTIITHCGECDGVLSEVEAVILKKSHDYSKSDWLSDDSRHWKKCANCSSVSELGNHNGGTPTYTDRAECRDCGKKYGELRNHELVSIGEYCIVYSSHGVPYNNSLAATDLQTLIMESTGVMLNKCEDRYYQPSYGKMLAIGLVQNINNITDSLAPSLKAQAAALGNDGYIVTKDDKNNIYLCGGGTSGDRNAVYEFLNLYFGFEQYAIGNHYIDRNDTSFKLDMYYLETPIEVTPDIAYRSNGYNGISADANGNYSNDAYRMKYANNYGVDLLMFVNDGDWNSKSHNSLAWLPYDTYSSHPKWYNSYGKFLFDSSDRDLCYTAHGDASEYSAMIAECVNRAKQILAIPANSSKTVLQFGKQDETPVCTCTSCTDMKNTYGSSSATVIKFMNDLMAAIEADSSITRKDFNIIFFAYEDFEAAPTKAEMKLHDRINVMLAAAYSFNYQASIYDTTNDAGRSNLQKWGEILGDGSLFLWTYSSKFNTFMYPTDTFAFYNEDAYRFFADNKVDMFFNQSQGQQTGAVTAWGNLKMYLDAELSWDNSQKQSELIDKYMNAMFGPAAEHMKNYFESVRAACQRQVLVDAYAAQSGGHAYTILGNKVILKNTSYWECATIDSWLAYCDAAYEAIKVYENSDPEMYERLKRNIDTEWVCAAFMRIDLYGETSSVTVAKFEEIAITKLNMAQCRERYPNNISDLQEYINTNWK